MHSSGATATGNRLKIGFVLARSFTLSAFALFVDTMRLASDELDRSGRILADWQVLGSTRHLITSSCGVQVAPTSDFVDPSQFDYIVVVGGLLSVERPVDQDTIEFLHSADAKKVPLIGLCTGSFILAEAGLMRAHQTCVSWLHYQAFREQFPDHHVRSDRIFNLDRNRGSCAGGSSAADLAASLVRRYISKDAERNALEVLQIEKARSRSISSRGGHCTTTSRTRASRRPLSSWSNTLKAECRLRSLPLRSAWHAGSLSEYSLRRRECLPGALTAACAWNGREHC